MLKRVRKLPIDKNKSFFHQLYYNETTCPAYRNNKEKTMTRTYLTYSRDAGNFKHDLTELRKRGLCGLRIINKGKSTEEFIDRIEEIFAYNRDHRLSLEVLIDLPGEKPLIGNVGDGLKIKKAGTYILCGEKQVSKNKIPTINLLGRIDRAKVFPGDVISIADGEVEMSIVSMNDHSITCAAQSSSLLTSNRSLTIKGNKLPVHPVSDHDRQLLEKIRSLEIAKHAKILVSFITKASQVKSVRDISPEFQVISKIENVIPEQDLEEIIRISDGIMLGRGDLVSTSRMSEVFPFQKRIIEKCKALNKELILATGLFGDLKNSTNPSISDILDFGFLRSSEVDSFLITGSNAIHYPFETLSLITSFEES